MEMLFSVLSLKLTAERRWSPHSFIKTPLVRDGSADRAFTALAKDRGSILSTHTTANNYL